MQRRIPVEHTVFFMDFGDTNGRKAQSFELATAAYTRRRSLRNRAGRDRILLRAAIFYPVCVSWFAGKWL
jgi:hypothetical protein